MTYALCFVCQDVALAKDRGLEARLSDALAEGWKALRLSLAQLEPLTKFAPVRPPHGPSGLGAAYALGPESAGLRDATLGRFAVFQPDPHGDRLLQYRGPKGWYLRAEVQPLLSAFADAYWESYPWGRVGVWLADLAGAEQAFRLSSGTASSIEELAEAPLTPNRVSVVAGPGVA